MEHKLIKFKDVCVHHKLDDVFITQIQEFEMVKIVLKNNIQYISTEEMPVIERVIRLHYDLNINMEGIEVIQQMRSRIENLQEMVHQLKQQIAIHQ